MGFKHSNNLLHESTHSPLSSLVSQRPTSLLRGQSRTSKPLAEAAAALNSSLRLEHCRRQVIPHHQCPSAKQSPAPTPTRLLRHPTQSETPTFSPSVTPLNRRGGGSARSSPSSSSSSARTAAPACPQHESQPASVNGDGGAGGRPKWSPEESSSAAAALGASSRFCPCPWRSVREGFQTTCHVRRVKRQ